MTLEHHQLTRTGYYPDLLSICDLPRRKVVEFGAGEGFLTKLILAKNPMHVTAYEIVPNLCKIRHGSLTLKTMDFTEEDYSYLRKDHCVIAHPPISRLAFVLNLLDQHQINDALLLVTEKEVSDMEALGFTTQLVFAGDAFEPEVTGFFFVMKRGF